MGTLLSSPHRTQHPSPECGRGVWGSGHPPRAHPSQLHEGTVKGWLRAPGGGWRTPAPQSPPRSARAGGRVSAKRAWPCGSGWRRWILPHHWQRRGLRYVPTATWGRPLRAVPCREVPSGPAALASPGGGKSQQGHAGSATSASRVPQQGRGGPSLGHVPRGQRRPLGEAALPGTENRVNGGVPGCSGGGAWRPEGRGAP